MATEVKKLAFSGLVGMSHTIHASTYIHLRKKFNKVISPCKNFLEGQVPARVEILNMGKHNTFYTFDTICKDVACLFVLGVNEVLLIIGVA